MRPEHPLVRRREREAAATRARAERLAFSRLFLVPRDADGNPDPGYVPHERYQWAEPGAYRHELIRDLRNPAPSAAKQAWQGLGAISSKVVGYLEDRLSRHRRSFELRRLGF